MVRLCLLLFLLYVVNIYGQQTIGCIELSNPKMSTLVDTDTGIEVLAREFQCPERPLWATELNGVLFKVVPKDKAYLWTEKDGLHLGTTMPGKKAVNCEFDLREGYLYLTSIDVLAKIKLIKP